MASVHFSRLSALAVGLFAVFAADLAACSGPGAPTARLHFQGIATLALVVTLLLMLPILLLRFRRVGVDPFVIVLAFIPLVHLQPIFESGSVDCGRSSAAFAKLITAGVAALLAVEVFRSLGVRRDPRPYPRGAALLATLLLTGLTAGIWMLPWSIDPAPLQYGYMHDAWIDEFRHGQDAYYKKHGRFASDIRELVEDKKIVDGETAQYLLAAFDEESRISRETLSWTGQSHSLRMLQIPDAPAHQWAVIARPVGFPEKSVLHQFIVTSDGQVWAKPDPRDGSFLASKFPNDPASAGWIASDSSFRVR